MALSATNPGSHGRVRRKFELHHNLRSGRHRHHMSTLGIIVLIVVIVWVLMLLLQPAPKYHLAQTPDDAMDSPEFARQLEAMTDTKLQRVGAIDVLDNGENFYQAELSAIRGAKHNVNLEAYIFHRGQVANQFRDALTERAHAGVQVRVVIDAMGSFSMSKGYFKPLTEVGGHVEWYHPLRWNDVTRINNRTHREMLIVDGQIGFIGGAGIDDQWLYPQHKEPRWRDTVCQVRGEAVEGLQSVFLENWLNSSGEILAGAQFFPAPTPNGNAQALVIDSSPSFGGSTRGHVLFQALLGSARKSIYVTTPYFLPDSSLRQEMIRAIKQRGVQIKIITPGRKSDHAMTRGSSSALYGDLLQAGAEIYEYQPTMIHAKIMIVDGLWSVVGSTNFDNRSFGINDEVNLAARSPELAARLTQDFENDLAQSRKVTYEEWKRRPIWERAFESVGWFFQRQQ
ncbi:MAG TPA: phospholipase D-like domain-containing protein [Terriglobales bacterium]|nr:phospholipase D-like domain-containing protein [Terriglobales bacterium]